MVMTNKMKTILKIVIGLLLVLGLYAYIRVVAYENSLKQTGVITMMTDTFSGDLASIEAFQDLCYEETGIELYIIEYPKTNWELFLFSSFSSGSVADIAKASDNLNYFIDRGVVAPMNPYMEESKPMQKLYNIAPENFDTYTVDGQIYGIGKNRITTRSLWVRKDIMEALELEYPSSLVELEQMLLAFKAYDQTDGGLIIPGSFKNLAIFMSSFGLRPEIYLEDGVYVDPFYQPNFEAFSQFIKSLYDNKAFNAQFPTMNSYSASRKSFGKGEGYSLVMWDNAYSVLKSYLETHGNDGELVAIPAFETELGVFGVEYIPPSDPFVISSECENKEAAFRVLEWILTEESGILASSFGIEGINFTLEDNHVIGLDKTHHRGQSFPPIDKTFEMPYILPDSIQETLTSYETIMADVRKYEEIIPKKQMVVHNLRYNEKYVKILEKRDELFFDYLVDEITYSEMMSLYEAFYIENEIDEIIEELNGKK